MSKPFGCGLGDMLQQLALKVQRPMSRVESSTEKYRTPVVTEKGFALKSKFHMLLPWRVKNKSVLNRDWAHIALNPS